MFKGTSTDDVHVKYCVKWVTRKRHIIVVFNVKCVEAALGYKVTSIEKPCVDPITWSIGVGKLSELNATSLELSVV